jgi:hypothetical protein
VCRLGREQVAFGAVEKLNSILGGARTWVESHALAVGVAGLLSLLVGGGLALAGVGGQPAAPMDATGSDAVGDLPSTTSAGSAGTTADAPNTTPLPVAGDAELLAVRIDNHPGARPQVGIQEASLVIETPVEGGLTRFTAFYEEGSYPVLAGPVRSVRPVDADLTATLSSVMISTGGQPFVLQALAGAGVANAMPDTAPGFQALERPQPHHLFVDLVQVQSVYPAAPAAVDAFPAGEMPEGADAPSVTIPYSSEVSWQFDGTAYARSEGGEPFSVLSDPFGEGSQLTADTVVVLFAAQRSAGYTDAADADVPTFDVIGAGRLLVFNGGEVVEGEWSRAAQADGYVFTAAGEPFGLPAGRTHVAVVPRELQVGF